MPSSRDTDKGPMSLLSSSPSTFAKAHVKGALIQLTLFCGMTVVGIVAPRILGASRYGVGALIMSILFFFQGLLEAAVFALVVKWRDSDHAEENFAFLHRFVFGWFCLAIFSTIIFIWTYHHENLSNCRSSISILAVGFLAASFVSVLVQGRAYFLGLYGRVLGSSVASGLCFVSTFWLIKRDGVPGFVGMQCLSQVAIAVVILMDSRIRAYARLAICGSQSQSSPRSLREQLGSYFRAASPRLALIMLNTVTVFLSGLQNPASRVGSFKVALTLVGASLFVIPISPTVLQAEMVGRDALHQTRQMLLRAFLLAIGMASVLAVTGRMIIGVILKAKTESGASIIPFFGLPFYALIPAVSAFLFGLRLERHIAVGLALCACGVAVGYVFHSLDVGFVLGAAGFSIYCWFAASRGFPTHLSKLPA